jgi:hypothetical protein
MLARSSGKAGISEASAAISEASKVLAIASIYDSLGMSNQRRPNGGDCLSTVAKATMFHFVTIIPLSFWAIVLLLLFMWAAFGLGGLVATVVMLALLEGGRPSAR